MLNQVFATKLKMSQGWTTAGKRVAITRCIVNDNLVVAKHNLPKSDTKIFEIGYGKKKLKNVTKPLRTKLEKSGFSNGISTLHGVHNTGDDIKTGDTISLNQVLEIGDVVKVQGTSKGRGFAGGMKRHNFHGGPKTHGQSDRARAIGSIGSGTTPGRVWKGKKMPGHYGNAAATVLNLVVLHIENNEVWLSGPVPGAINSAVTIVKSGEKKNIVLDKKASGIKEVEVKTEAPVKEETEKTEK
jgi:large subunit ribosomal protein L3